MTDAYQSVLLASIQASQDRGRAAAIHDAAWAAHGTGQPCRAVITHRGYGIALSGQWFDGETMEELLP